MKYFKIIFLSLGYLFILVLYLNNNANKTLFGIIFDSFWINCLTVLYFLLIHLTCAISFPEKFHVIRRFEKSGKLYGLIGVKNFKFILAKNPFPIFTAKLFLENYSTAGVRKLEKQMRTAEALHFLAFITSLIVMIPFGCIRDVRFFYFMIAFNIINNLYPMLVQRYNRNRIDRMLSL